MGFRLRLACAAGFAAVVLLASGPGAAFAVTEVGGGGGKATDCLTTFKAEVNFPTANPRHTRCVDGDPNCDADATVNGVCTIPLIVCANSTFSTSCNLNGVQTITVDHAIDNGEPKFDPDFQALQTRIHDDLFPMGPPTTTADLCTTASNIRVPIKGPLGSSNACGRGKTKKVKITTVSQLLDGHTFTDVDVMRLQCDPHDPNDPNLPGCDPTILFAGTFDRIQRQVFNQNCAVSGCHDSQSYLQSGTLLLETGASFSNLVNVDPIAVGAANAGWKRVKVITQDVSGDPATSLIVHKVEGDLPDSSYGVRMPKDRARLHATLRGIISTWILNGAPMTGWVPGTF